MAARVIGVVALLAVLAVQFVFAADHSKFRTCSDTGFCRRHRQTGSTPPVLGPWIVDKESILMDATTSLITGKLINSAWPSAPAISLRVQVLRNRIVHALIDEFPDTSLYRRHRVADVIEEDALEAIRSQKVALGSTRVALVVDETLSVFIRLNPFRIQIERNGELWLEANAGDLFNFEQYRLPNPDPVVSATALSDANATKVDDSPVSETPSSTVLPNFPYDQPGMWTETFSGQTDSRPRGPSAISMDVNFRSGSYLYGIPEHSTSLALKDTNEETGPFRLYNLDVFEYELDVNTALYGAIPFILAHNSRGSAGILWLNAGETYIDIHSNDRGRQAHWISESGVLDIFLFTGPNPAWILDQYTSLTGRPQLPARFALGYHQCRWNYLNEADVYAVDAGFEDHDIPYDVLWLDIEHTDQKKYFTWDSKDFPEPIKMQDKLWSHRRRLVTIVDPHIKRDDTYPVHQIATRERLYVMKADKASVFEGWCWPGSVSYLDFTNQKVRDFWARRFQYDIYAGSTPQLFTWIDMNEPSVFNGPELTMPKDCIHANDVEHRDVHNQYGFYDQMATFQGLYQRDNPPKRPFILSRSFFVGSQKYGAVWTGDNLADWTHLKASVPMLLSLGVSGLPFVGADVGGFFKDPSPELLVRWYQAAALQPFYRGHAHIDTVRREPWLFGKETTNRIRAAIRLRYTYMPYLYSVAHNTSLSGSPIMAPLWWHFPDDEKTFSLDSQYMLGSSLMVHPVVESGVEEIMVTFPPISSTSAPVIWYDVATYVPISSGQTLQVQAPIDKLPLYQRSGSIIARQMRARRNTECQSSDPLTLIMALDDTLTASGSLYIDDGFSFAFRDDDQYQLIQFDFKDWVLSSRVVSGLGSTTNVIERIVILGLKSQISQILLIGASPLEFTQEFHPANIVIRRPFNLVGAPFEIRLKLA